MKELFTLFAMRTPRRFTKRQKLKLLNTIIDRCAPAGHKWYTQRDKTRGKFFNRRGMLHLFIGDPAKAKVLVIAGYDTPTMHLNANTEYHPLLAMDTQQDELLNQVAISLTAAILSIGIYFSLLVAGYLEAMAPVFKYILYGLMLLINAHAARGIANRKNYNMNTAGVTTLCTVIEQMQPCPQIAYCFADQTCRGGQGYESLGNLLAGINPGCEVVILNAIAGDGSLFTVHSAKAASFRMQFDGKEFRSHTLKKKELDASPLFFFKQVTLVTCGKLSGKGISVSGVRSFRDTTVDLNKMEAVRRTLTSQLELLAERTAA